MLYIYQVDSCVSNNEERELLHKRNLIMTDTPTCQGTLTGFMLLDYVFIYIWCLLFLELG